MCEFNNNNNVMRKKRGIIVRTAAVAVAAAPGDLTYDCNGLMCVCPLGQYFCQ